MQRQTHPSNTDDRRRAIKRSVSNDQENRSKAHFQSMREGVSKTVLV